MGEEAHSWKNIVGARHSKCLEPLGKNASILDIFLDHLEVVLQKLRRACQND